MVGELPHHAGPILLAAPPGLLEAAEERLREALADGLAWVSFKISSSLSELTYFYFYY